MNKLLTWAEVMEESNKIMVKAVWDASNFCYDLFIDQQMNEGYDF